MRGGIGELEVDHFKNPDPHGYKVAGRISDAKIGMTRVQTHDGTLYRVTAEPTGGRYVAVIDYDAIKRDLMREADQNVNKPPSPQSAPCSRWLGDDAGNLNSHEMRLLRQSVRLQPRDISRAMLHTGRDCPPGVVSRWEQNSQFGPPADVCAFLWACDGAVEALAAVVLKEAREAGELPDRFGGKAEGQFKALLTRYDLSQDALQALQVSAWDRALMILRSELGRV